MLHATRPVDASLAHLLPRDDLGRRFFEHVARQPEKVAVVDDFRSVTYAQLAMAVLEFATLLDELGVRPGDVVSWQLPNCVEAVAVTLAAYDRGAVVVPVVPIFRQCELGFIFQQARPRLHVSAQPTDGRFDHEALARTVGESTGVDVIGVRPGTGAPVAGKRAAEPRLHRPGDANEISTVIYTSGTEARPKGVLHSQATLLYEADSMSGVLGLNQDDVFFMPSPVAHITGLLNGIITPLSLGCTVVLQTRWDPEAGLDLVERHRCTYSVLATPFLRKMFTLDRARQRLSSFRFVRCGGADIPATLVMDGEKVGVEVLRVYGLSELPTVTCVRPGATTGRNTDGPPLPNITLRIVDDAGRDVPRGTPGHLHAKGPELFLGYLDASLNAHAFDEAGFLRTGDLAQLDHDGNVRIVGRAKDIIVRGGENLSALEIEDALLAHPAVRDVAVVGVPDPVMGQRACAFVVSDDPDLSVDRLREHVVSLGLAVQKAPERLILVGDLPRTAAGKVLKSALREQAGQVVGEPS